MTILQKETIQRNNSFEESDFIEELLQELSLQEKVGQMTQLAIDAIAKGGPNEVQKPFELDKSLLEKAIIEYKVGSILNVPIGILFDLTEWQSIIQDIQKTATKNEHPIPILYGIDSIHGANYIKKATLFPQPISIAATWNTELAEATARATAYETRAAGIPWNFSPALDVCRHPAWPRGWESFGEDTYLNEVMGVATVKGYQNGERSKDSVAACLKHYIGYGAPVSGKDRTPALIPERHLRTHFLPPYEAAIKAGALSLMVNSGEVNGEPVHASKYLLTDILKKELGFKGLVVTDWLDVQYLHTRHKIAPTIKEAVRMAISAGIDMIMSPFSYEFTDALIELVAEGSISEERINDAVRRILWVKNELGLFEKSHHPAEAYPNFAAPPHQQLSYTASQESIVLLKNKKQLLPLSKKTKVLVVGPTAKDKRSLNGGWSHTWQGDKTNKLDKEHDHLLEAIIKKVGKSKVTYVPGTTYDTEIDIQAAVKAAKKADVILLCLGETSYTEFMGTIDDLSLEKAQLQLAKKLAKTGKPVVLLLLEGRPRIIQPIASKMKAIVGAFLPGPYGGTAIADVLYGDFNPCGKLPFTYHKYPHSLVPYDHKYSELLYLEKEGDVQQSFHPQYEFGHGLSYTKFKYGSIKLSKKVVKKEEAVALKIKIKNTGNSAGKEVVQLYVSDLYASITPVVKKLRAFQKVHLKAGEQTVLHFTLQSSDLAFVDKNNQWVVEAGKFKVQIGKKTALFEVVE